MKHRRSCPSALRLLPLLIFLSIYGCAPAAPRAEKGLLDLRGYNFSTEPPVELSGEWAFYWDRLFAPDALDPVTPQAADAYQILPRPWQKYRDSTGKPYPSLGQVSYRLRILIDSKQTPALFFLCKEQNSAYLLRVNGKTILSAGSVGRSAAEERPSYTLSFSSCIPESDTLDLLLQISNYHYDNGGAANPIRMGSKEKLLRSFSIVFMLQMISLGIMLIFFILYLSAFLIRRRERGNLLLALFCICWSIAVFCESADFRLVTLLFPSLSFEFISKLYFVALSASLPLASYFCASLFPTALFRRSNPLLAALSLAFAVLVLCFDAAIHSHLFPIFIAVANLFIISILHALYKAIRAGRRGSIIFSVAFILFCAAGVHDSLYNSAIIQSVYLCTYGATALILAEALILSRRHADTYRANEELLASLAENRRETALLKAEQQGLRALLDSTADTRSTTDDIKDKLDKRQRELDILQEEFSADINRINAEKAEEQAESSPYPLAVNIMNRTLAVWESSTGKTRADFAEASGLWAFQTDGNGWRRTATLDKYLELNRIPRLPKWRKVIDSAEFVLAKSPAGPEADALRSAVHSLKTTLNIL